MHLKSLNHGVKICDRFHTNLDDPIFFRFADLKPRIIIVLPTGRPQIILPTARTTKKLPGK